MIKKKRMLKEFYELVRINCPSRAEKEVANLLKIKLEKMKISVFEDNAGKNFGGSCGNIISYLKGNISDAPVIMFGAHMDCVQPCTGIYPVLKNGIITSKSNTILGSDDKAGIVGILEAIRIVKEKNIPHGDIQIIFTVAEEDGLYGVKNIDKSNLKADFGYILDAGGSPGEIISNAPGQNSINITIYGKAAHAGEVPEEGINAIIVAGKIMSELKTGRIDFETTSNIGKIIGGVATNIVPDKVEIKCEVRSRNINKLREQTKYLQDTFMQIAIANGARAEINNKMVYKPYTLSEKSSVVLIFKEACKKIGLKYIVGTTGGGSDANLFNSYKLPTAVLGIGMSKVHTKDEFIKEVDLYNIGELVIEIIKTAAKFKK